MNPAEPVTGFTAGRIVGAREIHRTHLEDLASLMVGRKVNLQGEVPPKPVLKGPVLQMKKVNLASSEKPSSGKLPGKLKDIELCVRGGEIVGVAGVEGNGQT